MLAARDQENLAHAHQTTAAAKPLNQGTRQLNPKTPGMRTKTPFKVALNDENDPLAFGKKTVKGNGNRNENFILPGKGGFGGDKNAFVTPSGPRSRAPLGMKTTNAKAKGFATPAVPLGTVKPGKSTRKVSTVKKVINNAPVKSAEPELSREHLDVEDRDIEYMPPKPKELPDPPEDLPYNTDFPQFKGQNLTRGWELLHDDNPVGEDGLTRKERQWREEQAAHEKRVDDMIQKQFENMELRGINVRETPDEPCADEIRQKKLAAERQSQDKLAKAKTGSRGVSTIKSRNAAAALSQQPTSTLPRPRTNTAQTSRPLSSRLTAKKPTPPPSNQSAMRHTAATANSRSTLGYTKGRNASSTLSGKSFKPHADQRSQSPIISQEMFNPPSKPTAGAFDFRSRSRLNYEIESEDDDILDEVAPPSLPIYEEDEETANFQLTL